MREDVLAAVLAADKDLSRDEPEVAANIGDSQHGQYLFAEELGTQCHV